MRRIALMTALLGALAAWVTSLAGASDTHTYHIQMYNAFGVVNGSNVRIAGGDAGTVTDLGITAKKRADLTIETSGPLGVLGKKTRCASQPQSLIAEYFITCNPKGPPLPAGADGWPFRLYGVGGQDRAAPARDGGEPRAERGRAPGRR